MGQLTGLFWKNEHHPHWKSGPGRVAFDRRLDGETEQNKSAQGIQAGLGGQESVDFHRTFKFQKWTYKLVCT